MSDKKSGSYPVKNLKWPLEDGLPPLHANNFSLIRTSYEVVLLFGDFIPTGFAGRSQDEIEKYMESATVRPLSKIVMSNEGFRALFNLLKSNYEEVEAEKQEK